MKKAIILFFIFTSTHFVFCQDIKITRGSLSKAHYSLTPDYGKPINGKYYFHLISKNKKNHFIDVFDSNLEFIESIKYSSPSGYYHHSIKQINDKIYGFYYGKGHVLVEKYDLVTGTLNNSAKILTLNSLRSKIEVNIINDSLISVYSPFDKGVLKATLINQNLNVISNYEIPLPTEVDDKFGYGICLSPKGEIISNYFSKNPESPYKGCSIIGNSAGTKINYENHTSFCQFALYPISENKSIFIKTTSNFDVSKAEDYQKDKAGIRSIEKIHIYSFDSLKLIPIKSFKLNQMMKSNESEKWSNLTEEEYRLSLNQGFILDGKLKYLILNDKVRVSEEYIHSSLAEYYLWWSLAIEFDDQFNPKFSILNLAQSGTNESIGISYSIKNKRLNCFYSHVHQVYSKKEEEYALKRDEFKSLYSVNFNYNEIEFKDTLTNFKDSSIESAENLFVADYDLKLGQNIRTSTGIIFYEISMNGNNKRLVKIDLE